VQGSILIVDAIATNRIVLKVKLASAYYAVTQAGSLAEATRAACAVPPDLVITALDLEDGSAADLCARMASHPATDGVPVLAIGNRDQQERRMATLAAGAEDVMLRPLDETLLLGRVRSLIRARLTAQEWHMRDDTSRALGLAEPTSDFGPQGHCVLLGPDKAQLQGWARALRPLLRSRLSLAHPGDSIKEAAAGGAAPDVFVLALPTNPVSGAAALRPISTLRTSAATRHAGILVLQTAPDPTLAAQALDLGADDLMTEGFDPGELALRLKALLRRKRMGEQLRATVRTGLRAAICDPLTGLHNRRYAMPHLARMADHAVASGRPCAVMLADLDHFKQINDHYGHASGDAVLVEVARRLRGALRAVDMVARMGGEEFLVVMPGTSLPEAEAVATRLCEGIGGRPFEVPGSAVPIPVTVSIGMALGGILPPDGVERSGEWLLEQADRALYAAKLRGRNQVKLSRRPAA
jgi:two-component system, cell cycle response regulator